MKFFSLLFLIFLQFAASQETTASQKRMREYAREDEVDEPIRKRSRKANEARIFLTHYQEDQDPKYLLGYMKLAFHYGAQLVQRKRYQGCYRKLRKDLKGILCDILNNERSTNAQKGHAHIWYAKYMMKYTDNLVSENNMLSIWQRDAWKHLELSERLSNTRVISVLKADLLVGGFRPKDMDDGEALTEAENFLLFPSTKKNKGGAVKTPLPTPVTHTNLPVAGRSENLNPSLRDRSVQNDIVNLLDNLRDAIPPEAEEEAPVVGAEPAPAPVDFNEDVSMDNQGASRDNLGEEESFAHSGSDSDEDEDEDMPTASHDERFSIMAEGIKASYLEDWDKSQVIPHKTLRAWMWDMFGDQLEGEYSAQNTSKLRRILRGQGYKFPHKSHQEDLPRNTAKRVISTYLTGKNQNEGISYRTFKGWVQELRPDLEGQTLNSFLINVKKNLEKEGWTVLSARKKRFA